MKLLEKLGCGSRPAGIYLKPMKKLKQLIKKLLKTPTRLALA